MILELMAQTSKGMDTVQKEKSVTYKAIGGCEEFVR